MRHKNSLIIGFFSIVAILLGLVRDRLLAQIVGIGTTLDLYNAAFRVPDALLGITLSFAASSTVIPFLSKAIKNNNKEDLENRFNTLFFFFGLATFLLACIALLLMPYLAHLIVPGFSEDLKKDYIFYTRLLLVQPVLLGLSTLISTIAQSKHRFYIYSVAPLLYTLGIIAGVVVYPIYGQGALFVGVVIGSVLHIALQSITLYRENIKLDISKFHSDLLKEQLAISIPRSGSFIINQVRLILFASAATTIGVGALSIYLFGQRIFDAIMQILPQSISTASLPSLSHYVAEKRLSEYKKHFLKDMSELFVLGCLGGVVLYFLATHFVVLLYGHTGFTGEIAEFVKVLALVLPFSMINSYMAVACSALHDTRSLFVASLIATLSALVVLFETKTYHGLYSIAYAINTVSIVYCGVVSYVLIKHLKNT